MNLKSYSDWLLVSDIDGTLNNKLRRTPKVNTNAIDEFVHQRGGNFTLTSARNVHSLAPHYKKLPDVDTPAIVLNGAGIYDFKADKMLWFNPVSVNAKDVIGKALKKFPFLEIGIFTEDSVYLVRPIISSFIMMSLDSLKFRKFKTIDEVPMDNWGKIIFFCMPWNKDKIKDFVAKESDDTLTFIDTSFASFDMVAHDTNKGTAVLKLADILGINKENIGAIGNYYNDLDMLKAVKHSACCKQSPEDIHEICEYSACHCNDGAVADFISYIYQNY